MEVSQCGYGGMSAEVHFLGRCDIPPDIDIFKIIFKIKIKILYSLTPQ